MHRIANLIYLISYSQAAFVVAEPFRSASSAQWGLQRQCEPSPHKGLAALPLELTTATSLDNTSSSELPLDFPRRDDVMIALTAVRNACRVTASLQPIGETDRGGKTNDDAVGTVTKDDLSPVTVADFAVQGLVLHALKETCPSDGFIAEEDSRTLQSDQHLCARVAEAASLLPNVLIEAIDLGKSYLQWNQNNCSRPARVWVLDPIDGTRGFLRGKLNGGQYAIALALLEDGVPVIGILGCPNLPMLVDDENYAWTSTSDDARRGCIFVASRGGGCYQLELQGSSYMQPPLPRRLQVTSESCRSIQDARFCIGVESYSDALGQCATLAVLLHGGATRALDNSTRDIVRARRMDSQAKHGVIARGGAELYVRLPPQGYVEWIWDHAAGNVVIEEAGGAMSDIHGEPIDFSLGAQLSPSVRGVLMSSGGAFHQALVQAYAKVNATEL
jgi:3'(2'), 5'-bisphosphate nucleotidase